ncbi:NmrA family transcriptional regulator, partial [Micromonospora sp. M51]|nr:NmrA family transcriptional regulator [Micromonospora sp. M51]
VVHATQFFEFLQGIIDAATDGDTVHLAPVLIQPMAADDVAAAVTEVALGAPTNSVVEVAGPEQFQLDELGRSLLADQQDRRTVVADPDARYFGARLNERSLVPADGARTPGTALADWRAAAGRER